jgi:hypothetical protein
MAVKNYQVVKGYQKFTIRQESIYPYSVSTIRLDLLKTQVVILRNTRNADRKF